MITTTNQQSVHLPDTCSERAGRFSDYLHLFDLVNTYSLYVNGRIDLDDPELIRSNWESKNFNPETDVHTIFDPYDRLVGLIETWTTSQPPVHPWNWVCVHPDYANSGLWEYLLQWGENRSIAALELVSSHIRVAPITGTEHHNQAGIQAIRNQGWKPIRSFYHMGIDLVSTPVVPAVPPGIIIRRYNPLTEREAVYRAFVDSFKDHFGYVEQPFEHGFSDFKHDLIDSPGYDPNFWVVAVDGNEIAGICISRPSSPEDPECGWVCELGVRRAWRKRGLGFLLLKQAFSAFHTIGRKRAGLGVDASSLTGALRLYERAGMQVVRQFDHFEKELRAGIEISTQELL